MTVSLGPYLDAVPQEVVDRIRGARRVLAVSHENPDADTLGATLGVVRLVEAMGGVADAVCTDPVPPLYDFIEGVERFRTDPDETAPYDLLVISDCGSLERVGEVATRHAELFARLPRVIIDHHASNDAAGAADWIDPQAAATCEMVTLLAARLGVPLDADGGGLAAALMAGIVMDTATFAHPNATPRTLVVSAALVDAGAPLADISRRLYRTKPDAQLRLFGVVLGRLETVDDGRIVWSSVTDADFAATGAQRPDSEGIIDLLSQADAAEVAILFKQSGEATRVSVRTKPGGVDATVLTGRVRGRGTCARGRGVGGRAPRGGAAARAGRGDPAGRSARPLRWRAPRSVRVSTGSSSSRSRLDRRRTTSSRWCVVSPRRSGSATAGRSTRSRRACCRSSWVTRRVSSSTTSATARHTARPSASAPRRRPRTSKAS